MTNYKIILGENNEMEVPEYILVKIPYIKKTMDDTNPFIFLKNINHQIFSHILTLIKYQSVNTQDTSQLFIKNFISNMSTDTLFDFIIATNNLELYELKNYASSRFYDLFNSKTDDEIRRAFCIPDDISKNDKQRITTVYNWSEDEC